MHRVRCPARAGRTGSAETMDSWRYSMWAYVKRSDGRTEEREFPAGVSIEIGDILEDGSIVVDVPYPDDIDDDAEAPVLYDD